jgi:hypothetical protein
VTTLGIINALRWALVGQTALGCVLCVVGVQTAIIDLVRISRAGQNGGKRLANRMRLQVAVFMALGFFAFFLVGIFFTTPITEVTAENAGRMVGARVMFNAAMLCFLLTNVAMYLGRRKMDGYYDKEEADRVLRESNGLHTHHRDTDGEA